MSTELSLQNEEADFHALKKAAEEAADQCNKILVTDATTLAIANQNLSLLTSKMKQVEDLHKKYKAPYWAACKSIDGLKNALYDPMELALKVGKQKILDYDTEQQKKAEAETERMRLLKLKISQYSEHAIKSMDASMSIEHLDIMYESYVKNFPAAEEWEEFNQDAQAMRANLKAYASQRKIQILNPAQADDDTNELIKEAIAEEVAIIGNDTAISQVPIKGIRGTWSFELVDAMGLPRHFLMPDEKAINAFAKYAGPAGLVKDGEIREGVKYYIKQSLTIR